MNKTFRDEIALAILPEIYHMWVTHDGEEKVIRNAFFMADEFIKQKREHEEANGNPTLSINEIADLVQPSTPLFDNE